MKKNRQEALLALIEKEEIATQEDLMRRLNAQGFTVTQATVSRDIKALKLVKSPLPGGQYKYALPEREKESVADKFRSILDHSVLRVDHAGNMVCVKCYSGMANAACAAVDELRDEQIVGTIAGDDTFFVLCRDEASALTVEVKLKHYSENTR